MPAIRYVYDGEGKRMRKTVGGLIAKRELKRISRKTRGLSLISRRSHTASHGCIILGPKDRKPIADCGGGKLQVLP
jgi:hypothetical protein